MIKQYLVNSKPILFPIKFSTGIPHQNDALYFMKTINNNKQQHINQMHI